MQIPTICAFRVILVLCLAISSFVGSTPAERVADRATSQSISLSEARAVAIAHKQFLKYTRDLILDEKAFSVRISYVGDDVIVFYRPSSLDEPLHRFRYKNDFQFDADTSAPFSDTREVSIDDRGIGAVRCRIGPDGTIKSVEEWSTTKFVDEISTVSAGVKVASSAFVCEEELAAGIS